MEIEYIFKSTDESAMVEGCKFFGGLYMTKDLLRAASLRQSKLFGRTIVEITKEIKTIQKYETTDYSSKTWAELVKIGTEKGLYHVGIKKAGLIKLLKEAESQ